MGTSVEFIGTPDSLHAPIITSPKPSHLVAELAGYRSRMEHLGEINELQRRLAGILDLASMVEAYSIWLGPHLEHSLIGYRNFPRKRINMTCSSHGPKRRELLEVGRRLLYRSLGPHTGLFGNEREICYSIWTGDPDNLTDRIVIIHNRAEEYSQQTLELTNQSVIELSVALERAITYEELYDQARKDELTGLVNRRVFMERAVQEMANAERYAHPTTLACLDLDHFKVINDRLGHAAGDHALKQVAKVLGETVRDSDLLARVGGDEFQILLPNTGKKEAANLGERLCRKVAGLGLSAPGSKKLGVSIGLVLYASGVTLEEWFRQGDEALYQAKSEGRSQVSVF